MKDPRGAFSVRPNWSVVPPGVDAPRGRVPLVLDPGEAFGTGGHETTRLCLHALALFAPRARPWRLLDFGSGTGVLTIAAAKLGASAVGIEIDLDALRVSAENARRNDVEAAVRFGDSLKQAEGRFDVIVANILRPILLEYSEALAQRLAPEGRLILSGIVSTDVPELGVRFSALLGGREAQVYHQGEWRVMVW